MREINSVYIGETGKRANQHHNHRNTVAIWGHEPIISYGFEDFMREIWRVYIGETGNKGKPRRQPLQHENMNQPTISNGSMHPRNTPHPVYFPFWKISWRWLNGLGPSRELVLRDCVPGTLDNGWRRDKRHGRREYAIHPRVSADINW